MEAEKILLESLVSKISYIPGGISIYDSSGKATMLTKPTAVTDLQTQGVQSLSKQDLLYQGITVQQSNKGMQIKYTYPKTKQTLLSFQGILPAYTIVFTNPSEDPAKQKQELVSDVFQTQGEIELTDREPSTILVRRIQDGKMTEISRLGHFIALSSLQKNQSSFPPSDLRLYLPPVHIPSQHLGDCAADTMQTMLFFADGFVEDFAEFANTLYTKYIKTEPSVIFNVDDPKRIAEIRSAYGVSESLNQMDEAALAVFSSMVRRYILVRLLDFGTDEEIERLRIPVTTCLFPYKTGEQGEVPQRRKSINVFAGSTIARKISRVFEFKSMLTKNLTLEQTELALTTEHKFFCLLFALLKRTQFNSLILNKSKNIPIEEEKIRAISFSLLISEKNSKTAALEEGGHAISLFRFQDVWYLQDDNIGIAAALQRFQLDHFLKTKGEFFISSYKQLQNKSDLIEQGYYTEKQLQQGKALSDCFYGYRYFIGTQMKEKILYRNSSSYGARYNSGEDYLVLCLGDISEEQKKKAAFQCGPAGQATIVPSKVVPKIKNLPLSLQSQMNIPTGYSKEEKKQASSLPDLRKNIQANLTSFNTTLKQNVNKKPNATRKVKPMINTKILSQFTSF